MSEREREREKERRKREREEGESAERLRIGSKDIFFWRSISFIFDLMDAKLDTHSEKKYSIIKTMK